MTTAATLPEPGAASVADRAQISRRLIQQAREELDQGDRLQATEKAWGAFSQMMKAHGQRRGWLNPGSHRTVGRIAMQLAVEYSDEDISNAYSVASECHENFYENHMHPPQIGSIITEIASVLPRLERALSEPPRPVVIREQDLWRVQTLTGRQNLRDGDTSPVGFSNTHRVAENGG